MNAGNLTVGVEVDSSKLVQGIKKIGEDTGKMTNMFGNLGKIIAGAFAVQQIISFGKKAIDAYSQQEIAIQKLNAALRQHGEYSDELINDFKRQASELQILTGFQDDAITNGQALAISMGLQADTVKQITPLILDFAAATGRDLRMAFELVTKAGLGEVDQLKRYGIIIDENELKTKGFNAVLNKLQENFDGTAEVIQKSGVGPMKEFQNIIGDLMEDIGEGLVFSFNTLYASIKPLIPFFSKLMISLTAIISTAIEGITNVADLISNVLQFKFKEATEASTRHVNNIAKIWSTAAERMIGIEESAADRSKGIAKKKHDYNVALSEEWKNKLVEAKETEDKIAIAAAERLMDIQFGIQENMTQSLENMLSGNQSFGESVAEIWEWLKHVILRVIAEEIIATKAAAVIKIAAEKAVAMAKAIAAYTGIPFLGVVLAAAAVAAIGNMFAEKIASFKTGVQNVADNGIAYLHKGEAVIPAEQNPYTGHEPQPAFAGAGIGGNNYNFNFYGQLTDTSILDKWMRSHVIPALKRYRDKTPVSPYI